MKHLLYAIFLLLLILVLKFAEMFSPMNWLDWSLIGVAVLLALSGLFSKLERSKTEREIEEACNLRYNADKQLATEWEAESK